MSRDERQCHIIVDFPKRTDGYSAFRVNSIVAKRKKKEEEESLEREEKEDERRIIRVSIERNRWEDAKQTRFPEWQSSSFENPIFQDFGYTTAMTSKWISSSMTHAILINFSSNRRAIPNTKIISGQMFSPLKISTIDASVT